jgi:predicted DCC family thiol-disulfide oxidoreductase YuxK
MNFPENTAVILFDGICNLCNASVNLVIKHDRKDHFRFAPLQSQEGIALLKKFNVDQQEKETVVLIENNQAYTRSSAALRIAKKMSGLYPLLFGFIIVPPFLRNAVYDLIARKRYKWFGKKESCMIPTKEIKQKFIV